MAHTDLPATTLLAPLLAALDEPIFAMDLDGRVTYATPSVASWTGRDANADAPYAFADIFDSQEGTRFQKAFRRIADGKTDHVTIDMQLVPIGGEGATVPVEIKLNAITGASGKTVQIAGRIRDVSAEIAAEAAVNLQSTHLLGLVENVADGCVIEDADGAVEMVNAAFCSLFAIKAAPQSLIGTDCKSLFASASAATGGAAKPTYLPPAAGSTQEEVLLVGTATVTHKAFSVEHGGHIAGRLHVFHAAVKVSKSAKNAKNHANAGDSDPVSRNASEAAQAELIEEIARNLTVTVEGAGTAIHRAEQLEMPGNVLEHFRRVETAARAALTATAGLSDFGKFDAGRISLIHAPFRLRDSIASLLETLMPQFESRGVRMKLRLEQDVPEQLIGDGARLMSAIRNLIDCELAHIDREGKVTLLIEPEYAADKKVHLSFTVQHTQPKRTAATSARTRTLSATELMQLSLARQAARALAAVETGQSGGKLDVRERKDGTSYQFAASFTLGDDGDARNRPTYFTLTGMPVLIVSADSEERQLLADLVRSWRMHPREADNTDMALHLLHRMIDEERPIPLVITANTLPVQDGFTLAFRIKHQQRLKETTIVMLARDGKPGDAMACRENGISAYLRHPVRPDQLSDALDAVLGIGAKTSGDSERTHTLVTRHSLREAKVGTVLVIDGHRDQGRAAAQILRRREYRVVLAESADEAFVNLHEDIFDAVIVAVDTPGFASGASVAAQLQKHIGSERQVPIIAAQPDNAIVGSEFSGSVAKPYERDALLEKIRDAIPEKIATP